MQRRRASNLLHSSPSLLSLESGRSQAPTFLLIHFPPPFSPATSLMSSKCCSPNIFGTYSRSYVSTFLVPKSRRQACAGNVVVSKGQVPGHTPFCGLPDSVSAPPTIFSARHFFHKFSRNIYDLESNSGVLHTQ